MKVKPVHTLDLVVLAAEWGHGRRTGVLSNLHLGAPDPEGTARAVDQDRSLVRVQPELVVEVAFDGVQSSSRYPVRAVH